MMTAAGKQLAKEQAKAKREHLELTFKMQLRAAGIHKGWVCEHQFHPERKWRFDFAFVGMKLAIEVEGGTASGKSRHSKGEGFDQDAEKYNTASAMGWTLFRFSAKMINSGKAILFVEDFLKMKGAQIVA
jgi:very-short-patch-repair endonuclease